MAPKPLMPLDEAWARLRDMVVQHVASNPLATENVDSFEALGRVLA